MKEKSLTREIIYLVKGANKELSDMKTAFNFSGPVGYNKECASGFYMIRDEDIAETYAIEMAKKGRTEAEKHAIINYYRLDLGAIKRDLKQAYFNKLNSESMTYVGENILGQFPRWCEFYNSGFSPMEKCHDCDVDTCNRNADYIEAILSYNGEGKTLDDILKKVATGDLSEEDAIDEINNKLMEWESPIRIQVVLRKGAENYIEFSHVREVDFNEG